MEHCNYLRHGELYKMITERKCFECHKTKNLIVDTQYENTYWCKEHYKDRWNIIQDFLDHALYGR